MNEWPLGSQVRCTCTFADSAGVPTDPDEVYFQALSPAGTLTSYHYSEDAELVKDDTGDYHALVDADDTGRWHYRFYSTGVGQSASETLFLVKESGFD